MEENKYQEAYYELKSSLKGEKYLGQEVAKLDLGDTMLVKSQTKDGKLCWIVENKEENIKPDYIEAFENIIFQKRDNGYISDAYRNDISVVYEAFKILEILKNQIDIKRGLDTFSKKPIYIIETKRFAFPLSEEKGQLIKEWLENE